MSRWWALIVLCMGALMIVVDMTIVNVALPSIGADLGFSQTALVWVVNGYTLTFGGFLLLGGRLGDIYGQRRVFLIGIVAFTATSLICGLAVSQGLLVAARALQGVGGAVVDAVALSLIVSLFPSRRSGPRRWDLRGLRCAGGGSIGVLLGGLLTNAFQLALDLPRQPADRHRHLHRLPAPMPAAAVPVEARAPRRRPWRSRSPPRLMSGVRRHRRQRGGLDLATDAGAVRGGPGPLGVFIAVEARPVAALPCGSSGAETSSSPTSSASCGRGCSPVLHLGGLYLQGVSLRRARGGPCVLPVATSSCSTVARRLGLAGRPLRRALPLAGGLGLARSAALSPARRWRRLPHRRAAVCCCSAPAPASPSTADCWRR